MQEAVVRARQVVSIVTKLAIIVSTVMLKVL